MSGNLEDAYVAKETPMIFYLNIHMALEQMRTAAQTNGTGGPRVIKLLIGFQSILVFYLLYLNKIGNGSWS